MKKTPLRRGNKPLKRSGFTKRIQDTTKEPKTSPRGKKVPKTPLLKPVVTITKLKKKLWKLFSKFIRERDNYNCFTCGKQATGSAMHAGHFITGATCPVEMYFDETNVHAQCYHCNINLSGNWVIYEQNMIKKYGEEITNKLKLNRTLLMGQRKESPWYQEKIKYYENQNDRQLS